MWSGGVDGYLRPDQFLDHLTVIKKDQQNCHKVGLPFICVGFKMVLMLYWCTAHPCTNSPTFSGECDGELIK